MFYLLCDSLAMRTKLINDLKNAGILSVFHYLSLHKAAFYESGNKSQSLLQADYYTDHLLRLPFYYSLTEEQVSFICNKINQSLQ